MRDDVLPEETSELLKSVVELAEENKVYIRGNIVGCTKENFINFIKALLSR